MKKKISLLPFIIFIFLSAAIFTAAFWDSIWIRVSPKTVLTSALTNLYGQLEQRFQNDPLLLLLSTADPEGKYTTDVSAVVPSSLVGEVKYDVTLQTNGAAHQIFAIGSAEAQGRTLDLTLYLDRNFAAISSEDLSAGKYYGITYDTFATDVRSIPMLRLFASESTIAQWDASVQNIQAQMEHTFIPTGSIDLPAFQIEPLLLGLLALPCEIEEQSISVDGEFLSCDTITYPLRGSETGKFLTSLSGDLYGEDTAASVSFYLYDRSLVRIALNATSGVNSVQYALHFGLNPFKNTIQLAFDQHAGSQNKRYTIAVDTQNRENQFFEVWNVNLSEKDTTQTSMISYDWKLSSGDMNLQTNQTPLPLKVSLTKTEKGIRIASDDFSGLLHAVFPGTVPSAQEPVAATVTIRKGADFSAPEYLNLNQWSTEDLLILIKSVGALLGIDFSI